MVKISVLETRYLKLAREGVQAWVVYKGFKVWKSKCAWAHVHGGVLGVFWRNDHMELGELVEILKISVI